MKRMLQTRCWYLLIAWSHSTIICRRHFETSAAFGRILSKCTRVVLWRSVWRRSVEGFGNLNNSEVKGCWWAEFLCSFLPVFWLTPRCGAAVAGAMLNVKGEPRQWQWWGVHRESLICTQSRDVSSNEGFVWGGVEWEMSQKTFRSTADVTRSAARTYKG